MARKGTTSKTMYTDPEIERMFQVVQDHYGKGYSASAVLVDLVRKKCEAIESGQTRRQIASETHKLLQVVEQKVDRLLEIRAEVLEQALTELREGVPWSNENAKK